MSLQALAGAAKTAAPRKDDPGTERYMDYFYKNCVHILFKPFHDLPEWRNATGIVALWFLYFPVF
jgi:protein phosphatase-4 regulatory subunit 3